MSREDLLRNEGRGLALLGVLAAEGADEVLLRLAFLRRVYARATSPQVDFDVVVDLLEDHELALTDDEAVATLVASGMLEARGGTLLLADPVVPKGWSSLVGDSVGEQEISGTDLVAAIVETRAADLHEAGFGPVFRGIDQTTRWGIVIAKATPEELDGVPCFWDYDETGYRPFNLDPASVTTSDALRLVVERHRVGASLPVITDDDRASIARLWTKLLDLQRSDMAWTTGSFSVAGEDDDFVGAFDPTRPELGPCPTVDATGGAVVALASILDSSAAVGADDLVRRSGDALRRAVDFLLRSQLPGGGWPLFRYENDAFPMVERDVSSWYAVEALAAVNPSHGSDESVEAGIAHALERFVDLAETSVEYATGACAWKPDFVTAFASESGRLQATATVCMSLDAATRRHPELRSRTSPLLEGGFRYIAEAWEPDPQAIATINFRVPTWDGPAATRFPWEWPLDALIVQMLSLSPQRWDNQLETRVSRAVAGFLETEVNGHWDDFLMKREGNDRAVVGSTIFYHSAMLAFARHEVDTARRFVGVAS